MKPHPTLLLLDPNLTDRSCLSLVLHSRGYRVIYESEGGEEVTIKRTKGKFGKRYQVGADPLKSSNLPSDILYYIKLALIKKRGRKPVRTADHGSYQQQAAGD